MRPVRPSATVHRRQQEGFSLIETIIAVLVATILVTLAAGLVKRETDDAAARGTGKYLLQLRAAVVDLQLKHEAWLRGEPLSDVTAAAAPSLPGPPSVAAFKPLTVAWMISRH
ncbi:prepilin-type N-terminal cleavage/methylation domain-containing protein [Achromobacter xylosoxidans]